MTSLLQFNYFVNEISKRKYIININILRFKSILIVSDNAKSKTS